VDRWADDRQVAAVLTAGALTEIAELARGEMAAARLCYGALLDIRLWAWRGIRASGNPTPPATDRGGDHHGDAGRHWPQMATMAELCVPLARALVSWRPDAARVALRAAWSAADEEYRRWIESRIKAEDRDRLLRE
jgi:hypothetical protein